jgi:two-component system, sporulation sensor kinase B
MKMSVIKDFLLQIMLIAIPMFTFHTFFTERLNDDKRENLVKSALWGITVILCMSFPASFGTGYRLDLRAIPLLLGTLYCGFRTGLFLLTLVILYRIYFSIDIGFYNTVFALLCSVPVIIFFQKSFQISKRDKRVKIAVLLSLYYSLIGMAWFAILRTVSLEYLKIQIIQLIFVVSFTWFFTTLNEMIREIHQLRLEVQKSEKLRIISDLTSVFAHEIRNPMQVTRGFLQLLDEPDLPDKKKEYIHISIEELDRANEIINDLLSFGKPSTSNNERVDVGYQIRRVISIIQTYAMTHNVAIKTYINDDCWINANAQKLSQCLINILKNAIESMPNGGEVHVSCTSTNDGHIKINVEDEGIGMTKDEITRLGSPYYSLKESGTGLGMMVSFQIIRSFEGKVQVTSQKDTGTIFSIFLPREG